jgi:signal transduction histidine kinase
MESVLALVFRELIENAVNYRAADQLDLQIKARRRETSWLFSIDDNGIGIDPRHRESVFEPCFTVDPRSWRPGLGLVVARTAVAHLGGSIWVESSERGGCNFQCNLPGSVVLSL